MVCNHAGPARVPVVSPARLVAQISCDDSCVRCRGGVRRRLGIRWLSRITACDLNLGCSVSVGSPLEVVLCGSQNSAAGSQVMLTSEAAAM